MDEITRLFLVSLFFAVLVLFLGVSVLILLASYGFAPELRVTNPDAILTIAAICTLGLFAALGFSVWQFGKTHALAAMGLLFGLGFGLRLVQVLLA